MAPSWMVRSRLLARPAQNMKVQAPRRRMRILIRSHHASGFRVRRSSSRTRLWYSGRRIGPGGSGRARPVSRSEVISALLYGPRLHDLVDGLLVVEVAVGL